MAIFGNAVDRGMGTLRDLQKQRQGLALRRLAVEKRIAELRDRSPEDVLDELLAAGQNDSGNTRRLVTDLQGELEDINRALPAICQRVHKAAQDLASHRAAVPRAEAQRLRRERESHDARTAELLAELRKHQGVAYGAIMPQIPPPGVAFDPISMPVSNSERLRQRIAALEAEAARIEQAAANRATRGGRAEASSLEELLKLTSDPEAVAPFEPEVRAWFAAVSAEPPRTWYRPTEPEPEPEARSFILAWDRFGRINTQESMSSPSGPWSVVDRRLTLADEIEAGKRAIRAIGA